MTASHNAEVLKYLKDEMARLAKSRGDRGYIKGYSIENPSTGKFVVTIATPKALYGAGLNVHDFLMAFTPFIKVRVAQFLIPDAPGEEKFTQYTIES